MAAPRWLEQQQAAAALKPLISLVLGRNSSLDEVRIASGGGQRQCSFPLQTTQRSKLQKNCPKAHLMRSGLRAAVASALYPPSELPTSTTGSWPPITSRMKSAARLDKRPAVGQVGAATEPPAPGRQSAPDEVCRPKRGQADMDAQDWLCSSSTSTSSSASNQGVARRPGQRGAPAALQLGSPPESSALPSQVPSAGRSHLRFDPSKGRNLCTRPAVCCSSQSLRARTALITICGQCTVPTITCAAAAAPRTAPHNECLAVRKAQTN